jgi:glycosyltransferase involved in cell wall biosynthesis
MQISTVIPTCNRKTRLLFLLKCLNESDCGLQEVIVVDSGEDRLLSPEIACFNKLHIQYVASEKSVCVQRNIGISLASSPWIFICDDDIEVPADYLAKLTGHIQSHPQAGAVSGLILQKESGSWTGNYPVQSNRLLLWKFIFQLSIWGRLQAAGNGSIMRRIKQYYDEKSNHLSKAGWPVITNFSGDYFTTPVYGLGASLVKKEWLNNSPFDEVLDRHGIGDNYGVAAKFPGQIHVVNNAFVYHHQDETNRLQHKLVYYRRALALDYFSQTIPSLKLVKKRWLLWSLTGNLFFFIFSKQFFMIKPALKTIAMVLCKKNPYLKAATNRKRIIEPLL